MFQNTDWCAVVPMANEEQDFAPFADALKETMTQLGSGKVYFVVDGASKDRTRELCDAEAAGDARFVTVWAPENRNVVDAYLAGFRVALAAGHEIIIEMDGGLSHDPRAIPMFLRVLNEGNECAFGSRFINGGSVTESNWKRWFLSRVGTLLANMLLGTVMKDMTSGFQGFHRGILQRLVDYSLLSKAHFYQTEVRYLLRKHRMMEVPIHYRAPSPRVSEKAIMDSFRVLFYYFKLRLLWREPSI